MSSEKAKEALKREEEYLLEVQKAVEEQIALLKAEQVVLQRQIQHHEGLSRTNSRAISDTVQSVQSEFIGSSMDSFSNTFPDLNLDVDMDTSSSRNWGGQQPEEEIESEEDSDV